MFYNFLCEEQVCSQSYMLPENNVSMYSGPPSVLRNRKVLGMKFTNREIV